MQNLEVVLILHHPVHALGQTMGNYQPSPSLRPLKKKSSFEEKEEDTGAHKFPQTEERKKDA